MTSKSQRACTVSPPKGSNQDDLLPLREDQSGDLEAEDNGAEGGLDNGDLHKGEWSEVEEKVEELQRRVAEHFENENDKERAGPPMVRAPNQPTREQWNRHQTTHTI